MSFDQPARRLTAHEVERVMRRAIDLQHAADSEREGAYTLGDVEQLGAEVGLAPQVVRTALVQVEQESVAIPRPPGGWLDRAFGPAWVVASRTVPGPAAEVHLAIRAMLHAQRFCICRNLGATVVWTGESGWFHGIRRALEFGQRYRLSADVVVMTVTDSLHHRACADVRIEAGFQHRRAGALQRALAGSTALGGGATAIALGVGTVSAAFAPLVLAGIVAGGTLVVRTRRKYRRDLGQAQLSLERFLDYLERERVP